MKPTQPSPDTCRPGVHPMIHHGFDLPALKGRPGTAGRSVHDEEEVWKDRRAHQRRELVVRADVTLRDGARSPGITENVSQGGMFVGTLGKATEGDIVIVTFRLPGRADEIVARAEVVRVRQPRAERVEMMPGLGLRFVVIDDEAFEAIGAYVERRSPRFAPA